MSERAGNYVHYYVFPPDSINRDTGEGCEGGGWVGRENKTDLH